MEGVIMGPEPLPGNQPAGERIGRGQGTEAEKARYVGAMFGMTAPRYDLTQALIRGGVHVRWKRPTAALVPVPPGGRTRDVCLSSGDLACPMARHVGPQGRVLSE